MARPHIVYGSAGSGSVPIEAALTLIGARYEVIGESVVRDSPRYPEVFKVNPLSQVPVLILPSGEVMTESAAILIWLADGHPDAQLAPGPRTRSAPLSCAGWPMSLQPYTPSDGRAQIRCVLSRTSAKERWCSTASPIDARIAGGRWTRRSPRSSSCSAMSSGCSISTWRRSPAGRQAAIVSIARHLV